MKTRNTHRIRNIRDAVQTRRGSWTYNWAREARNYVDANPDFNESEAYDDIMNGTCPVAGNWQDLLEALLNDAGAKMLSESNEDDASRDRLLDAFLQGDQTELEYWCKDVFYLYVVDEINK